MPTSIVGYTLLADPLAEANVVTFPVAGVAYTLDIAWTGQGVDSVALSLPGVAIDRTYRVSYTGHFVSTGLRGLDMGWSPDLKPLLMGPKDAGLGYWRVTFPATGVYTGDLSRLPLTFTVVAPPASPVAPTWTVLSAQPMNRAAAKIGTIAYTGPYPAGGLDMSEGLIGVNGVFFGDVNAQPPYQFAWVASKLHVYNQTGEVAAGVTITFTTGALFVGAGQ